MALTSSAREILLRRKVSPEDDCHSRSQSDVMNGDNELHPEYIVPSVFDKRVAEAVAHSVEEAAYQTGVARRDRAAQEEM